MCYGVYSVGFYPPSTLGLFCIGLEYNPPQRRLNCSEQQNGALCYGHDRNRDYSVVIMLISIPFINFSMKHTENYTRNLPHLIPDGATFFITFRLKGSIPSAKLIQLKEDFELAASRCRNELNKLTVLQTTFNEQKEILQEQIAEGPQYLRIYAVASILKEQIHKYDNQYYDLISYCIMPNHVHLLVDTSVQRNSAMKYVPLNKILQLLKGASAFYCHKLLKRSGAFWMSESYDHYIRSDKELDHIHCYILDNPVKAGLVSKWQEWEWTYSKYPPE